MFCPLRIKRLTRRGRIFDDGELVSALNRSREHNWQLTQKREFLSGPDIPINYEHTLAKLSSPWNDYQHTSFALDNSDTDEALTDAHTSELLERCSRERFYDAILAIYATPHGTVIDPDTATEESLAPLLNKAQFDVSSDQLRLYFQAVKALPDRDTFMLYDVLMAGEFANPTDAGEGAKIQRIDEQCAALEEDFMPPTKGGASSYYDEQDAANEGRASP